jgi:hypothetical protein
MRFDRETLFRSVRPIIDTPGVGVLQSQVEAFSNLVGYMEADTRFDGMDEDVAIQIMSYFLATVAHETTIKMKIGGKNFFVKSFQPVEEMGGTAYLNRMYDTRTDLGNTPARDGDGAKYAGDGYVQNTGLTNARTTGRRLAGMEITWNEVSSLDHEIIAAFTREGGSQRTNIVIGSGTFAREHELLRIPKISYLDAIDGILTGRYTGKKASDYFRVGKHPDYYNARRIINGINKKNAHVPEDIARMSRLFEAALSKSIREEEVTSAMSGVNSDVAVEDKNTPMHDTPPSENLGAIGQNPAASPQAHPGDMAPTTSESSFTAYIPHMDTAKSWIKRAITALVGTNVLAWYADTPAEIRYALLGLVFLLIGGSIYVFVNYHKQIFSYVTRMNEVRALSGAASFTLEPHKK